MPEQDKPGFDQRLDQITQTAADIGGLALFGTGVLSEALAITEFVNSRNEEGLILTGCAVVLTATGQLTRKMPSIHAAMHKKLNHFFGLDNTDM